MAKNRNSSDQDFVNNSDGFLLGGGTTERKLTVTGADMTLTGSGTNTYTFPAATDTLVGRASTDTLTNKTIDGSQLVNTSVSASKLNTGATSANVATSQTTTSTSYADLATTGPAVTVTIGANLMALVVVGCNEFGSGTGTYAIMAYVVSGANTVAAADAKSFLTAGSQIAGSSVFLLTGLTAGSTTFTAKYRVVSGTGTFADRNIAVIPL